jgi:hypothetical protein
MMRIALLLLFLVACGGEHRPARDTYNEGVDKLIAGEHEAAQKLLLEARSAAGVDPELRFRAAFDLGVSYAQHAQKTQTGQEPDLAKALELAQQAVSWFSDALRLQKDDPPTVKNLAIMRARVQAISDELRKSESKLEARLDAAIKDQREVLEEARIAWYSIKASGGSDPLAEQGPMTSLADRERGVVSEVGVVSDLAADEIDEIARKPEDKRTDEEKMRMVQLKALDLYVQDARSRISEARRKLQELAAEEGVNRAEAALIALKRAREQLLDPISVLKGVAQDEVALIQDTVYGGGGSKLLAKPLDVIPGWLAPNLLAERQSGLKDRVGEVQARLMIGLSEQPKPDADPKQQKTLERVRAAMPSIVAAGEAMNRARDTLAANKLTEALDHERAALEAIARAIEQFSDLKQTIELAYGEQLQVGKLLSPDAKDLDAKDRATQTRDGLARNVDRMKRLQGLIGDALTEAEQAPGPQPGPGGAAVDPKQKEAHEQQLAQMKQQYARAEQLRGEVAIALDALGKALVDNKDPLPHHKEAATKLTELRKLFFSVIEHLQQLIRDQGETRDQTSAIAGVDDIARAPKLPGLITREEEHSQIAKAIVEALAAQADAAGKSGQPPQPGQPDAKTFAAAAKEVRQADSAIDGARSTIVKVRDATNSSQSMKPALEDQAKAIEHLEAALELLQPPKKDQQKQDQQKQDQQEQKQDQQQQQQQGAQRARDDDARQQKKRRDREAAGDPVEKDW